MYKSKKSQIITLLSFIIIVIAGLVIEYLYSDVYTPEAVIINTLAKIEHEDMEDLQLKKDELDQLKSVFQFIKENGYSHLEVSVLNSSLKRNKNTNLYEITSLFYTAKYDNKGTVLNDKSGILKAVLNRNSLFVWEIRSLEITKNIDD